MARKLLLSPFGIRNFMRLWGPFIGANIRVTKVSPDFKEMEARMKLHWYNKNLFGTQFGGSLFSMTDPFYPMMLMMNIGGKHIIWDKSASIEFVSAVKTEVRASFKLSDERLQRITEEAKDGEPHFVDFKVDILDLDDNLVARCTKVVYVRRKPNAKND